MIEYTIIKSSNSNIFGLLLKDWSEFMRKFLYCNLEGVWIGLYKAVEGGKAGQPTQGQTKINHIPFKLNSIVKKTRPVFESCDSTIALRSYGNQALVKTSFK